MAKAKTELSPIQIAAKNARAKVEKATEAVTKTKNAQTEKALADAESELAVAVRAENRERFERVGGGRVAKALSSLDNIAKLAKPRSYEYSDSDVAKMEAAITSAAVTAVTALRNAKQAKKAGAVAGFKF